MRAETSGVQAPTRPALQLATAAAWSAGDAPIDPANEDTYLYESPREARARRDAIAGELAARRMPDLRSLEVVAPRSPTLLEAANRWQASRVDVSDATATYQRSALNRQVLHGRCIDEIAAAEIAAAEIAALIGELHEAGRSRETIRKTVTVLSMIFDYHDVQPNRARNRVRVKLPREKRAEIAPPSAWADVDEPRPRLRVSRTVAKTR